MQVILRLTYEREEVSADCCMREVEEDGALNGGRGIIKKERNESTQQKEREKDPIKEEGKNGRNEGREP